ncbi:conserved hypothetical protein [Gammaproteobacteria bacterium]
MFAQPVTLRWAWENRSQDLKTLALVGMPGSGKSVVTEYLQKQGFQRIYFGDRVLNEVKTRGLVLSPENERLVREEMRREHGMAIMAMLSLPVIRSAQGKVVIDGLYSFSEYRLLRQELGKDLVLIAVVATRVLRYSRLSTRPVRPLTPMQAEERDLAEIEHLEKGGPIAIADYTLLNNGSQKELLNAVDDLLLKI